MRILSAKKHNNDVVEVKWARRIVSASFDSNGMEVDNFVYWKPQTTWFETTLEGSVIYDDNGFPRAFGDGVTEFTMKYEVEKIADWLDTQEESNLPIGGVYVPDEGIEKVFIIGRHSPDGLPYEVVGQEPVQFPADSVGCLSVLEKLHRAALHAGADAILFQGLPAQVVPAIQAFNPLIPIGAIVSKPGERPAGKRIVSQWEDYPHGMTEAKDLVRGVNPRAKITDLDNTTFEVVVDPPMKFEFSHVQWL